MRQIQQIAEVKAVLARTMIRQIWGGGLAEWKMRQILEWKEEMRSFPALAILPTVHNVRLLEFRTWSGLVGVALEF